MAIAAPGPRRSLLGTLVGVFAARSRKPGRAKQLTALADKARQHVVTFAALAAMDLGAFQVWHHGGWFALAASLFLLDFAVSG